MTAANPSTAQAAVLVDELVRCGITDAVVAPGSRSTALVFALAHEDRIRTHVQIDERSAGFLALGLARATRRPAVLVTTSGTATVNLHPAVVEADRAAVPLLVVTADRPPEARETDANQTIRQVGLYGDSVRWSVDVAVAEDRDGVVAYWRSTICRAHAEATGLGRAAGPVHVNVPFREPTVPLSDDGRTAATEFGRSMAGRADGGPWVDVSVPRRSVPDEVIADVAARCRSVRRGVIVAGEGSPDADVLHRLAERLAWPVLAEPLSGVRDRSGTISTYHHLLGHGPFAAEHGPDLILRFGRAGLSRNLMVLLGSDVEQIAVLPDGRWSDPHRATARAVVGDPSSFCRELMERLGDGDGDPGWLASWRRADGLAAEAIDRVLREAGGLNEPAAARWAAGGAPDGSALVVGSSMPVRDLDAFMAPRPGVTVYGNRGASGIDGFVSSAIGVALGHAGPTLALAGDLSLLHDVNGFLLEPRDVTLTIVVVNNDGGGIFHFLPQARFPAELERLFATPHGRDLAAVVGAYGVAHQLVRTRDELEAALGVVEGIRVVEVRTERDANVAFHERVSEAVKAVLA